MTDMMRDSIAIPVSVVDAVRIGNLLVIHLESREILSGF